MLLCIDFLEEREREEKLGTMKNEIVSTSFLIRASNPSQPSATCILYIALPTCDGCDKF